MNIRNHEPTAEERVDHISSLLVNFNLVEIPGFSGSPDLVGVSREFPDPSEFCLEFMDDWRIVIGPSTNDFQGVTHTKLSNLLKE